MNPRKANHREYSRLPLTKMQDGDIVVTGEAKEFKLTPTNSILNPTIHLMIFFAGKMYDSYWMTTLNFRNNHPPEAKDDSIIDVNEYLRKISVTYSGIASHNWTSERTFTLGAHKLYRCVDKNLAANFASAAEKWDAKRNPDNYQKIKERAIEEYKKAFAIYETKIAAGAKPFPPSAEITSPTPFTHYTNEDRMTDPNDNNLKKQLDLYRMFRAWMRNHYGDDGTHAPLPLSKKKGVSCNQYVNYSLKVGILDTIFPPKLLNTIADKVKTIEARKKSEFKTTKLALIDREIFETFEMFVTDQIAQHGKNREWVRYKEFLTSPIKHTNPDKVLSLLQKEKIAEQPGCYFFREMSNNQEPEAWVMSHELIYEFYEFKKSKNEDKKKDSVTDHISETELLEFENYLRAINVFQIPTEIEFERLNAILGPSSERVQTDPIRRVLSELKAAVESKNINAIESLRKPALDILDQIISAVETEDLLVQNLSKFKNEIEKYFVKVKAHQIILERDHFFSQFNDKENALLSAVQHGDNRFICQFLSEEKIKPNNIYAENYVLFGGSDINTMRDLIENTTAHVKKEVFEEFVKNVKKRIFKPGEKLSAPELLDFIKLARTGLDNENFFALLSHLKQHNFINNSLNEFKEEGNSILNFWMHDLDAMTYLLRCGIVPSTSESQQLLDIALHNMSTHNHAEELLMYALLNLKNSDLTQEQRENIEESFGEKLKWADRLEKKCEELFNEKIFSTDAVEAKIDKMVVIDKLTQSDNLLRELLTNDSPNPGLFSPANRVQKLIEVLQTKSEVPRLKAR